MKYSITFVLCLIALFSMFSCNTHITENDDSNDNDTTSYVRKPNLYIYPTNEIDLTVKITFPNGGYITESIPEYNDGWNVTVTPEGIIDDVYNYLFYEYNIPNLYQKKCGWVIAKEKLSEFFTKNMKACGFNSNEIQDFTDYWIPLLTDYKYYEIYPQYNATIEEMAVINFSEEPENLYRLHYCITGTNTKNINLLNPSIPSAERQGYFAMEWGVVLE